MLTRIILNCYYRHQFFFVFSTTKKRLMFKSLLLLFFFNFNLFKKNTHTHLHIMTEKKYMLNARNTFFRYKINLYDIQMLFENLL